MVHLWEHADLLKLKAAVEKALEVTPEPPSFFVESGNGDCRTHVSHGYRCSSTACRVASFCKPADAEEYVAWKNSQEKP